MHGNIGRERCCYATLFVPSALLSDGGAIAHLFRSIRAICPRSEFAPSPSLAVSRLRDRGFRPLCMCQTGREASCESNAGVRRSSESVCKSFYRSVNTHVCQGLWLLDVPCMQWQYRERRMLLCNSICAKCFAVRWRCYHLPIHRRGRVLPGALLLICLPFSLSGALNSQIVQIPPVGGTTIYSSMMRCDRDLLETISADYDLNTNKTNQLRPEARGIALIKHCRLFPLDLSCSCRQSQ
jgi:hypothetical protein